MDGLFDGALRPGEHLVWADRARARPLRALGIPPRSPGELGRLAAIALGGAVLVSVGLNHEPVITLVALAGGAWWVAFSVVVELRSAARYALTDRGRGVIGLGDETLVFDLPADVLLQADPDLETGDLDLGVRSVTAHPGGRVEQRAIVLRRVSYPTVVLDLVRELAPRAAPGPTRPSGDGDADAR